MRDQIADELNVLQLENIEDIASTSADLVSVSIKANFRSLGAKYGGAVQEVAKLITNVDAAKLVSEVRASGHAQVGNFEVGIDDLVVTEQPKSGWSVASNNGESVALDLTLTQTLLNAGHVREVIRALQEGRKSAGLDISDRILVSWNATNEVAPAVIQELEHIKREVLATKMEQDQSLLCDTELGFTFQITRA
jgi:isoleucyl-tRNA synthetase